MWLSLLARLYVGDIVYMHYGAQVAAFVNVGVGSFLCLIDVSLRRKLVLLSAPGGPRARATREGPQRYNSENGLFV